MDDDIRSNFILKTKELLKKLEDNLIKLKLENSKEILEDIFRQIHSIKGNVLILEYNELASTAHIAEDLIEIIIKADKDFNQNKFITIMLELKDCFEDILENESIENLSVNLDQVLNLRLEEFKKEILDLKSEERLDSNINYDSRKEENIFKISIKLDENDEKVIELRKFNFLNNIKKYGLIDIDDLKYKKINEKDKTFCFTLKTQKSQEEIVNFLKARPFVKEYRIQIYEEDRIDKDLDMNNNLNSKKDDKYLNIKSQKLKDIISIIEDLTIESSYIEELKLREELFIEKIFDHIENQRKLLSTMQDLVMELKMVSINVILDPIKRMVMELSDKTQKEVELMIEDNNVEVDREIIESLSLIIGHIIKNAIDHGIESPKERLSKGKSKKGIIKIKSFAGGGNIKIQIEDDGKGLDTQKIFKKAIQMNIAKEDIRYSNKDIQNMIFEKGLSTKTQKTQISGRGMGMDIIKDEVENFGGYVDIESEDDKGSKIYLSLPSYIHINKVINIRKGDFNYSIPIKYVKEIIASDTINEIKDYKDDRYLSIDQKVYEYIDLEKIYENKRAKDIGRMLVIVNSLNDEKVIGVECIRGEAKIVIKKIEKPLDNIRGISGLTLLGDGKISFVLDTFEL